MRPIERNYSDCVDLEFHLQLEAVGVLLHSVKPYVILPEDRVILFYRFPLEDRCCRSS